MKRILISILTLCATTAFGMQQAQLVAKIDQLLKAGDDLSKDTKVNTLPGVQQFIKIVNDLKAQKRNPNYIQQVKAALPQLKDIATKQVPSGTVLNYRIKYPDQKLRAIATFDTFADYLNALEKDIDAYVGTMPAVAPAIPPTPPVRATLTTPAPTPVTPSAVKPAPMPAPAIKPAPVMMPPIVKPAAPAPAIPPTTPVRATLPTPAPTPVVPPAVKPAPMPAPAIKPAPVMMPPIVKPAAPAPAPIKITFDIPASEVSLDEESDYIIETLKVYVRELPKIVGNSVPAQQFKQEIAKLAPFIGVLEKLSLDDPKVIIAAQQVKQILDNAFNYVLTVNDVRPYIISERYPNGQERVSPVETTTAFLSNILAKHIRTVDEVITEIREEQKKTTAAIPPAKEPVGLINLGNTCFMNSALQALTTMTDFVNASLEQKNLYKPNSIATTYLNLVETMRKSTTPIAPTQACPLIRKRMGAEGATQEDASEVVPFLVNALLEDDLINTISKEEKNKLTHTLKQYIEIDVESTLQRNNPLETLKLKLKIPESYLSLQATSRDGSTGLTSLQECLNNFVAPETVEFEGKQTQKTLRISTTNEYVIIAMNPVFRYPNGTQKKMTNKISFPLELELQPYMTNNQSNKYDLIGVAMHAGQPGGGHYKAYTKYNSQWFQLDDAAKTPENNMQNIANGNTGGFTPQVLVYKRK